MDKKNFAFDKVNFILLAAGMLVVILGFVLMYHVENARYLTGIFRFLSYCQIMLQLLSGKAQMSACPWSFDNQKIRHPAVFLSPVF